MSSLLPQPKNAYARIQRSTAAQVKEANVQRTNSRSGDRESAISSISSKTTWKNTKWADCFSVPNAKAPNLRITSILYKDSRSQAISGRSICPFKPNRVPKLLRYNRKVKTRWRSIQALKRSTEQCSSWASISYRECSVARPASYPF